MDLCPRCRQECEECEEPDLVDLAEDDATQFVCLDCKLLFRTIVRELDEEEVDKIMGETKKTKRKKQSVVYKKNLLSALF